MGEWESAASWPGVIISNRSGGNGQTKGAVSGERKHLGCSLRKFYKLLYNLMCRPVSTLLQRFTVSRPLHHEARTCHFPLLCY